MVWAGRCKGAAIGRSMRVLETTHRRCTAAHTISPLIMSEESKTWVVQRPIAFVDRGTGLFPRRVTVVRHFLPGRKILRAARGKQLGYPL